MFNALHQGFGLAVIMITESGGERHLRNTVALVLESGNGIQEPFRVSLRVAMPVLSMISLR